MFPISKLKLQLGGRRPSVKDSLQWKIAFGGRRPVVEGDLRCKTTFGARQSSVVNPPLYSRGTTEPKQELL